MNPKKSRFIAIGAVISTVILFTLDGFFVHHGHWFEGLGILSSFIIPPIGVIFAVIALKKTDATRDIMLIFLNIIAFFLFFIVMFFGTLFFGP
ncbi:hypothetical protein [Paenibacillus sp. PL91]|uniref:hypothetical protein n=1 Tax=Paenibacillus sp. PL91 TaxID=2729538 RepID=UPI00145E79D1|nr:hypothetical protein [Paenibacillus sp. PL91]MBC9201684.1 hypothetical protein [Paenibacillus sp. PL91]